MAEIPSTLLQNLGAKSAKEVLLASLKWNRFAEKYFINPDDMDEPLLLEIGQKKAINALQFGYDINSVPEDYTIQDPPKIVCMVWPRQTGKTTGVAAAAATVLCLQKGVQIGVMGMSEPSAKKIVDKTRYFLENSPFKDSIEKSLKMEIRMKHGGYMQAHATSHSIRGQSYHYLILDEAAQIEREIIEGAALDTARKIGKRVILLSTPAGYGGTLVKYYKQGLKTRPVICKNCHTKFTQAHFKHAEWDPLYIPPGLPECPECGFKLPDAPNDNEPDIMEGKTYFYGTGDYTVISINPFTSSFYSKEEILAELERRGNTALARQELLGEIVAEGHGVFRKSWIDSCMDETLENVMRKKNDINYMLGVDFGKVHDNSVICVGHEDRDSREIILDYIRVIESEQKEYEDIKNQIIEVVNYYHPIWVIPDATGMGEPIIEQMQKDLRQTGWRGRIYSNKNNRLGFVFDVKSKPDLIENLVEYFARSRIRLPPKYEHDVDVMYNELLQFNYEMTRANYIKFGVQTSHDDTVIALALMVWGHKHKPWISPVAGFGYKRGSML